MPIDKAKIEEFKTLSKACDNLESKSVKAKLSPENASSIRIFIIYIVT